MFGFHRRLVRLCEWLRLIPKEGCLPHISQFAAMARASNEWVLRTVTKVSILAMEALRRLRPADLVSLMSVYRDLLRSHQESINRLNVFPVPDGDTGTNMALTVESVVAELSEAAQLSGGEDSSSPTMEEVCKAMAHGSLMGARGNSGVILSQLLRGMSGVFQNGAASHNGATRERSGEGADGKLVAEALVAASDLAHKAVLRPVEGTILTVAREAAEGAKEAADSGEELSGVTERARERAAVALANTPEQLPVLAKAGVVDAGGAGYLLMLDALLNVTEGRPLPEPEVVPDRARGANPARLHATESRDVGETADSDGDLSLGLRYEVMYLLEAPDDTIPAFKDVWAGLGDSIVVVGGGGLWNCHIHTDEIGAAIEAGIDAGRPRNIRVTDLEEQVEEERWVREGGSATPEDDDAPVPQTAVVAVAAGEGIARIFRSLGVRHVVPGGQSMNPSTEQLLAAVNAVNSPEVVLLPNNDNIHAVAMQVVHLADRPVMVVPTSGIVEGFAALLEYDPESTAKENAQSMSDSARRVVAGEVTRAVRGADTSAGHVEEGDWMGLSRDDVEVVGSDPAEVCCALIDKLVGSRDQSHELVTLIEGEGARRQDTRRVTEWLAESHSEAAVEVLHGGQPLYPYLIGIE